MTSARQKPEPLQRIRHNVPMETDAPRSVAAKLAGALTIVAAVGGGAWALTSEWPQAVFLVPVSIVPLALAGVAVVLGLSVLGLWLIGVPSSRPSRAPRADGVPEVRRRVIVLPDAAELVGSGGRAKTTPNGSGS